MYRILSVDDEPANQKLIQKALEKEYAITLAGDGRQALAEIESDMPDLVLLDVNMPVMNGLDTCRHIREFAGVEELPVIFISALSSLEDKLNGYEAGANDYIGKPIMLPELVSKIGVILEQKNRYQSAQSNLSNTRQAMFSAMNYAGELGSVIQFFESSFCCDSLEELGKAVFAAGAQLELSMSLQFRTQGEVLSMSCNGITTPLEEELLTQAQFGARIITVGKKSLYNAPCITILVKNMPVDDEELCGRIRDHLAIVLRACEAQIELIVARNEAKVSRGRDIDTLCQKVERDFDVLSDMLDEYQRQVELSYEDFRLDFQEAATVSDIAEDQLQTLMQSLDRLFETQQQSAKQRQLVENVIIEITEKIASFKDG